MNKYEKILNENPELKKIVLDVLQMLNGESYTDAKQILDLTGYFLKENSYVDYELAKDMINSVIEGD